jgi:hypothetical protein
MKNIHFKFSIFLILSFFFSLCRAEYQVYVQNLSKKELNVEVFTVPSGSVKGNVKEGDKEWVHLGKKCISYVTLSIDANSARWDYPSSSNSCRDLSLAVDTDSEGKIIVSRATYDLVFKGPAINGYKVTYPSNEPATSKETEKQPPAASEQEKTEPPPSKSEKQKPIAKKKTSYQVYIENNINETVTAKVYTDNGVDSKKIEAQKKESINLKDHCIEYILIQATNAILRWEFSDASSKCTDLSLSINSDSSTGKIIVDRATAGLKFEGAKIDDYKVSYPQFTPPATAKYQVYIQNQAKIDVDVHVFTKEGNMFPQVVFRGKKESIKLKNQCIDYILLRTTINEATIRFPPAYVINCTNLSLLVDVDEKNRPLIVRATNDLDFKGTPIAGWQIDYSDPLDF